MVKKLGYLLYLYAAAALLTVLSLVFAGRDVLSVVLLALGAAALDGAVIPHFIRKRKEDKPMRSWGICMVLLAVTMTLCAVVSVVNLF